MSKKPIVTFDIDDVLAASTEAIRLFVNAHTGAELRPEDYKVPGPYWDYHPQVWEQHGLKMTQADLEAALPHDPSIIQPYEGALEALETLAERFTLAAVSARSGIWEKAAREWLALHFGDLFEIVHFAGGTDGSHTETKGEMCVALGAKWHVDDHLDHCVDALAHGVQPILFGEYGWQSGKVPSGVVRCKDWPAVLDYFDDVD